jgi:UPF0755 protein
VRKKTVYILIGLAVAAVIAVVSVTLIVRSVYNSAFKPVSNSQKLIFVTVPTGASVKEIAAILKESGVIREAWAFEAYVRNKDLGASLQAGTYALSPSMELSEIADIIARGEIDRDLVTIVPGQRIDQVEATLVNAGFEPKAVERALDPSLYKNHPALVDKPRGASLEGYLYPDSYQKTGNTDPEDIIRASLDEMQERLTPSLRAAIAKRGLSVHEGIILASIIEREMPHIKDRPIVSQVFQSRLKKGMNLESDATTSYGAILNGDEPTINYDSQYNTYLYGGLPPGPISSVEASALQAVAHPSKTDYLFFVSGDDDTTHFSRTLEEHQQNVEKYCKKKCG